MSRETGSLHDPVTLYKITYTGEKVAQWDFQNKDMCNVWELSLCNLLTSICYFVPCNQVVQRAFLACTITTKSNALDWAFYLCVHTLAISFNTAGQLRVEKS